MKPIFPLLLFAVLLFSCQKKEEKINKVWLVGDSTMKDYPMTGWGQVFPGFLVKDSLPLVNNIIAADRVIVRNVARGGRSSRTFFSEGLWRQVRDSLQAGDIVLIQMGHNDATPAEIRPHRAVTPEAYQEFLRLYVSQSREKGANPILITPVNRNKWEDGRIRNSHGKYYEAMIAVSEEMNGDLIDLTVASMEKFQAMGQDYVTSHYFMNLPAGKFKSNPEGLTDNTHFQMEGAEVVAQLVFNGLKRISGN